MIIDTKQYNFSEWDSKRRERALHIMDEHVKNTVNRQPMIIGLGIPSAVRVKTRTNSF